MVEWWLKLKYLDIPFLYVLNLGYVTSNPGRQFPLHSKLRDPPLTRVLFPLPFLSLTYIFCAFAQPRSPLLLPGSSASKGSS